MKKITGNKNIKSVGPEPKGVPERLTYSGMLRQLFGTPGS